VPDITIRSTFIVGFPGETEQDFEQLLDWLQVAQLDRVGCFEYSAVAGAAANDLQQTEVPAEVKQERRARFMELAAQISAERLAQKIGRRMQVLVDRIEGGVAVARSSSDAPEIDGVVHIRGANKLAVAASNNLTFGAGATSSNPPDFVPFAATGSNAAHNSTVVRSHFLPPGIRTLHCTVSNGLTTMGESAECGGDVGGVVYTQQGDADYDAGTFSSVGLVGNRR